MFNLDNYKPRIIERELLENLEAFGAVCIEGPKYSGKTWTALSRSKSAIYIGDPAGGFYNRLIAQENPSELLKGEFPILVDEWQEVPSLWDAVRFAVDKTPQKGQFILTGSSTPQHKGVLHSGTGRISKIQMDTMSLYESGDSSGLVSLIDIFNDNLKSQITGEVSVRHLIYLAIRGGWPSNIGVSEKSCRKNAKTYLKTVVDHDVYRMDGIERDSRKMLSLLISLGRNISTVVSNSTLKRDIAAKDNISIKPDTISEYLDIFSRLFLIYEQPAFYPNLRSSRRLLKSPKRHFIDPSLAIAAIDATTETLLKDLKTFGFIFESMCVHDLKIYAKYHDAKIYHFRDEKGNEIDAVIQFPNGDWGAFEVKLGTQQIDDAAKNLIKIKKIFEREGNNPPKVLGVICGMTKVAYKRKDGVFVFPITALKP